MTGAEIEAMFFTPLQYFLYLFVLFAAMIAYYQWSWARKCDKTVKVLVVKPDGSTDTEYAPKSGGYVTLKSPGSNTTRLWPINKVSAIEMLYPGDGFIPEFLQKKIKTVIVDEEDWEPLLNRGSYAELVASPDVVKVLRMLADSHPDVTEDLTALADSLSTAPTREMVASPAVLGNLWLEKLAELAMTISQETLDKLAGLVNRLATIPNATAVYAGIIGILALLVLVIYEGLPVISVLRELDVGAINSDLQAIKGALGITLAPAGAP